MKTSNDYRRQFCDLQEEVKQAIIDLMQSHNLSEIELDEDGDGFYLFQRIPSVTGVIGGEPFSAFEDIHGCLTIEYCDTEGRRNWYFPCEEDADYLRPFIHASNLEMGHYPEQKACEDIAKIMKSWDYNIKL